MRQFSHKIEAKKFIEDNAEFHFPCAKYHAEQVERDKEFTPNLLMIEDEDRMQEIERRRIRQMKMELEF